jgi:hypothetical protein
MNMEKELKVTLDVEESLKQITPKQQKQFQRQMEKEEQRRKAYANGMATRAEAYSMAKEIAQQHVMELSELLRDPIRANLAQTMAVIELLKDKGIIKDEDELNGYYAKVLQALLKPEGEPAEIDTHSQD